MFNIVASVYTTTAGVLNKDMSSYSTEDTALAEFYTRCKHCAGNTSYTQGSVALMDEYLNISKIENIACPGTASEE